VTVVEDLLSAITADPDDEAPQLVIADHLMAEGDPRGELIVLDHRERTGQLDREALERLLVLAAEYGFPHADDRAAPLLAFGRLDGDALAYDFTVGTQRWLIRYAGRRLVIEEDVPPATQAWLRTSKTHRWELATEDPDTWTDDERHGIFRAISDAVAAKAPLDELRFPCGTGMSLPQHEGCPLRCYTLPTEFTIPREIMRNRYALAARDYHRWHRVWQKLAR
jgi:uncharacterized protein (TIGR02996 family)